MRLAWLVVLAAVAGQDRTVPDKVAKWVRDACGRNPLIRLQAARRVGRSGRAGYDATRAFVASKGRNALSAELVQQLGKIDFDACRGFLRELADDTDFTWRPQALLALAERASEADRKVFASYLTNASWLMRRGALSGWIKLGGAKHRAPLVRALRDPDTRVRVHAASLLLEAGDIIGLGTLVAGLDAEDDFFGEDLGYTARRQAFAALRRWAGKDFDYRPRAPRAQRRKSVQAFARAVRAALEDAAPILPAKQGAQRRFVLGFEQRSCRLGDVYLRLDDRGRLWRGVFDPVEVAITDSERRALMAAAKAVPADAKRVHGRIRCDYFRYTGLGQNGTKSMRRAPDASPSDLIALDKLWSSIRN